MIDGLYKTSYKTAEARALYLVAIKGYKSMSAMAKELGFTKQYYSTIFSIGLPEKYAGFLGRRFGFSPVILGYERYLNFCHGKFVPTYDKFFLEDSTFFTAKDIDYILEGSYIKDPYKFIRLKDKAIG